MNKQKTSSVLLASASLALAATALADTYTWLASPDSATWNTSALNWTVNGTDPVAWVNGNDAVFPASSSQKTIGFSGTITAHDITLNGKYIFNGSPVVTGKLTANVNGSALAYCLGGESVRIGGPANSMLYMGHAGTPTLKTMTLEDNISIGADSIRCFGPNPAAPSTNIVVTGANPMIYANNTSLDFSANRIVRIASGAKLSLTTSGATRTMTLGKIDVDLPEGQDFSSNTAIVLPDKWNNNTMNGTTFAFDPGEGWTNNVGQLLLQRGLAIKSGTTRLGSGTQYGTGDDALMHIRNGISSSATSFNEARRLVVDNATLYASQASRYVDVNSYGWVVVTNGGKVDMPGVHWLNGHGSPGRLDVADGGEFRVSILRLSQSGGSQIHLNEGGRIKVEQLYMATASTAEFAFNGGTFQSIVSSTGDGRTLFNGAAAKWANVTFSIGEKGAVFDATGQNIWWDYPLTSGVSGETDGGIRKTGSSLLLLTSTNAYTGPTVVEGGTLCPRVDGSLPDGTTVRLSGGALNFNSYETLSPARDSTNWVGRLEGYGDVNNCSALHVTNAIAPSVEGNCTLGFAKVCDLRGDYEVSASSNECSCIYFGAAGQDISGLKLKLVNPQSFDKEQKYRILRAPNGYTGTFDESALPSGWTVAYETNNVYLKFPKPFLIVVR